MSAPVLSRLFNALRKQAAGASTNNPFSPAQQEQPHRTSASGPRKVQTQPHVGRHKLSEKTLRPNPQSQSFSRSYGSILPTSLIYIVLSTRGCSPWRPAAVMSTTWRENYSLPRIFKGRRERTGPDRSVGLFQPLNPISRQTVFRVMDC